MRQCAPAWPASPAATAAAAPASTLWLVPDLAITDAIRLRVLRLVDDFQAELVLDDALYPHVAAIRASLLDRSIVSV